MKGLQMMLQALGIKIDPEQVEKAFNDVQAAIPEMVSTIRGFDARLARIEKQLNIGDTELSSVPGSYVRVSSDATR